MLAREGFTDFVWAFHDRDEIGAEDARPDRQADGAQTRGAVAPQRRSEHDQGRAQDQGAVSSFASNSATWPMKASINRAGLLKSGASKCLLCVPTVYIAASS